MELNQTITNEMSGMSFGQSKGKTLMDTLEKSKHNRLRTEKINKLRLQGVPEEQITILEQKMNQEQNNGL